jgi:hypothetical protein
MMFDARLSEECLQHDIRSRLAATRTDGTVVDLTAVTQSLCSNYPDIPGKDVFEMVLRVAIERGINCHWGNT